jgi:uncharacterized protein YukE
MVKFSEIPLDGDSNRAINDLNASVQESQQSRQSAPAEQDTRSVQRRIDDPRFAGKSTEEIVNMYRNLESHSGRLASQLGETKQALNQIILEKRTTDIRQNGGNVEPVKIQPTDLMVNPTEAIDRLLENRLSQRPELSSLQQRLNQLEAQLGQTQLMTRHPNAQTEAVDPAFQAWAQQTPLRQKLLADAVNNPYAAEALLTEWETSKPTSQVTTQTNSAQKLAQRVSLESGSTGSESGSGPNRSARVFKRNDLIRLRQTNPDLYESDAYQKEIVKAYREGRVVDG